MFILAASLAPGVAHAHELGFTHAHPNQAQAAIGGVETLMSQILAGRIQEVETQYLDNIAGHIESMTRLRTDARRRNDSLAASCVEQKLVPAQNLRNAASQAAKRLSSIPTGDIESLNIEAKTLSAATERVRDLATQARACVRINSGQLVSEKNLDGDIEPGETVEPKDKPADHIVPKKPATPVR